MEVLLNVLWFLICIAAGLVWLRCWRNSGKYPFVAQLCALICTLFLLFPIISASDDLYAARLAVETSDGQKNPNTKVSGKACRCHVDHSVTVLPAPSAGLPYELVFATVVADSVFRLASASSHQLRTRPPPVSFLA